MDSNVLMWAGIVGFFMPVLLAIVQQPTWSAPLRSIVMFVASIVAAVGTVYFTNDGAFTGDNMITTTVLQDIVVRGTDQLADEDLDKPSVARTVTVEVKAEILR